MLVIREMTSEDVKAVSEVEAAIFSMPWSEADFRDLLTRDQIEYLVAELDGVIIGGAGIRNVLGDGEITNVAILEPFRRHGYARELLLRLLDKGREMGAIDFTLEVRVSNIPAIRLYESLGFVSEGIRPNFYERPKEDAAIMWLYDSNSSHSNH